MGVLDWHMGNARASDAAHKRNWNLQIACDKAERRVELTATVSEAVADAFENAKALQAEGLGVVATDIAGARFVSRYHARIVERHCLSVA